MIGAGLNFTTTQGVYIFPSISDMGVSALVVVRAVPVYDTFKLFVSTLFGDRGSECLLGVQTRMDGAKK